MLVGYKDQDLSDLNGCGVPAFIFALTTWAELFLFALDIIPNPWEHNICAVTLIWWNIFNVQFPMRLGAIHNSSIRTNALASDIFILSLDLKLQNHTIGNLNFFLLKFENYTSFTLKDKKRMNRIEGMIAILKFNML